MDWRERADREERREGQSRATCKDSNDEELCWCDNRFCKQQ